MAANTIPTVSTLPPAPTRADAPADFTAKADTFVAALPPLVTQVNLTVKGMNDQASYLDQLKSDVNGYKNAAAQSATDAGTQAGNAQTYAGQAMSYRDSAQTAAQAAQASAGLPPLNNPLFYLRQKADKSGVEWSAVTQVITKYFESSPQALLSSSRSSVTHGLGGVPKLISAHLVCTAANLGFAVGDRLEVSTSLVTYDQSGTDSMCGFSISANGTSIDILHSPNTPVIGANPPINGLPRSLLADRNSWKLVVRAAL